MHGHHLMRLKVTLEVSIKAIVNNHANNILIEAERQRRWTGEKDISFFIVSSEDSNSTLIEETASDEGFSGDVFSSTSIATLELELDIQTLLEQMPEDLCKVFQLLQNLTITEAAKLEKVPRTTMSSRSKRLKKYLEEYLLKK